MKNISLCLFTLCPGLMLGGVLPEPVLPQGVGVNIHFTRGHEKDLDLIAAAGFKFIRMDLGWSGIERERGTYDWSAYDERDDYSYSATIVGLDAPNIAVYYQGLLVWGTEP